MITTPIIVIREKGGFTLPSSMKAQRQMRAENLEEYERLDDLARNELEKKTNGEYYQETEHLIMFIFIASKEGALTIEER